MMEVKVFIIGTDPKVSDNEVAIRIMDPFNKVSRNHCKIIYDGDNFFIEDLKSTNGTFIDEVKITSNTILNYANKIKLGKDYTFVLYHPIIQENIKHHNNYQYENVTLTKKPNKSNYTNNEFNLKANIGNIATFTLLTSVILFSISVFYKEGLTNSLISFASILLYLKGFSYLIDYFKSNKSLQLISYVNWIIILGLGVSIISFIFDILDYKFEIDLYDNEDFTGIFLILLTLIFSFSLLNIIFCFKIFNSKIKATTNLKNYAISSLIILPVLIISMFFEPEVGKNIYSYLSILDIIPTIFLIIFFYNLKET